jgi:hypothetical protein
MIEKQIKVPSSSLYLLTASSETSEGCLQLEQGAR